MDVLLKRGEHKDDDGDAAASTGDASEWAPRQFLCPITQALVMDPVVAADGHRQGPTGEGGFADHRDCDRFFFFHVSNHRKRQHVLVRGAP